MINTNLTLPAIISLLSILIALSSWKKLSAFGKDNPALLLLIPLTVTGFGQSIAIIVIGAQGYIDGVSIASQEWNFLPGSITNMAFTALFCLGLFIGAGGGGRPKPSRQYSARFHFFRIYILCLATIAAIIFALHMFSVFTGVSIFNLILTSNKQLVVSDSGYFQSSGYLRTLSRIGTPVFLVLLAAKIVYPRATNGSPGFHACLVATGIMAAVSAFTLSNRGAILFMVISAAYMLLINRVRVNGKLLIFGLLAFAVFTVMSVIRTGAQGGGLIFGILSLFLYGGGMSLFNTSVLTAYAITTPHLQLGNIYLGIFTLPIPRSLWPEKPPIALDQYIAREIYGIGGPGAAAIPAGLPGELLLNFGFILGAIACITVGILVFRIYKKSLKLERPLLSTVIRAIILPRFLMSLYGSGIGFGLLEASLMAIPAGLFYFLAFSETPIRGKHS